jgi:hypothetical protein
MNSADLAIQIIPDLTIDEKYSAIIEDALIRLRSFSDKAVKDGRVDELFLLNKTKMDPELAGRVIKAKGRLMVGFQFEARPDASDSNFRIFVKKALRKGKHVKFYLTPTVQDIMLQLISLEDRRTVAIFSMLGSSLDIGYRILTSTYGSQLRRLSEKAADHLRDAMETKLERLSVADSSDDSDLFQDPVAGAAPMSGTPTGQRPGSQDNILQVMDDDSVSDEINQWVENILSRTERIRRKREWLEENPDIPRSEVYAQMTEEDLSQLENCYACMHIYLRAFYKNRDKRSGTKNKILRQFFAAQIEDLTGETGLLEDLLSLNEAEYFRNLARHKEASVSK